MGLFLSVNITAAYKHGTSCGISACVGWGDKILITEESTWSLSTLLVQKNPKWVRNLKELVSVKGK